ncbi:hypothetical protein ALC60_11157 [Trachymyrmex zeteki]|uniref:Uncharacterized protein n=1 Tax=Mycetomoellerius zeteki TaxID=64791 RepID=A0A151WPZ3_9HYME|nr:hypothetical protein ALC60_11157 [Trachymyrmex zeteki]
MYALRVEGKRDTKKAKGVKSNVIARSITFDDYTQCLNNEIEMTRRQSCIRSKLHEDFGERAAATAVWAAMKAKTKIGMGSKTKKPTKKRTLPIAKRGGIIPILPLLGVVGSLVSGAAGVAKAINDNKAAQRQLEELKRHNRIMEGHGIYLALYKHRRGVSTKKIKKNNSKETIKMPKDVTTNV